MSARRYVLIYFALLSPLSLVILGNYLFLRSSGELLAAKEVVDRQGAAPALYGTATNHNTYQYKIQLYRKLHPKVVAVGSSRVMQFRGWFFDTSFVTMGGAMNSLREGQMLLSEMLRIHKPEVILFGLDFWWFDAEVAEASDDHTISGNELRINKLTFPVESLMQRKFTPEYFLQQVLRIGQCCGPGGGIGLNAAINNEGFGPDGSYYYVGTVVGERKSLDYKFASTINLARNDRSGSGHRMRLPLVADAGRLERLSQLLQLARDAGAEVIVFLPPVAPAILKVMPDAGSSADLARQIRERIPADVSFFDFTNPDALQSAGDCEFVDGTHGGDLLYLRIVAALSGSEPATVGRVAKHESMKLAETLSGLAMVPGQKLARDLREVDFLGLGCPKH